MRKINVTKIKKAVSQLCIKANVELRPDVLTALKKALKKETGRPARLIRSIIENAKIAKKDKLAICQDTGVVEVFLELGQEVQLTGGSLTQAIDAGVADGYKKGFFRKSVVGDPFIRKNTNTNTPSVIYTNITPGKKVKITAVPKGFGSENKSAIKMFLPTAGEKEIEDYIIDIVKSAGPEACPPFVLGIGIGGTMDKAAALSKEALLESINKNNPARHIAALEKRILKRINALKIGPMGLGGKTTALGVNMRVFPTHIAGLPVAVTMSCHATRGASTIL